MALFETIKYEIIKKDGNIQIRKYDDVLLASTRTDKTPSLDSGFNQVFQYIAGANDQEAKISMTTPVITYEDQDQLVTSFYVPKKYNKETIPKPTKENVFVNELKEAYYAVIRFRGGWTEKNFDQHNQILLDYLRSNHYEIISSQFLFRYQPPMVPGLFRRNEIAYQIKNHEINKGGKINE